MGFMQKNELLLTHSLHIVNEALHMEG
ncbi:DUF4024 domain-containing protein [Bacillus sp. JJ864]